MKVFTLILFLFTTIFATSCGQKNNHFSSSPDIISSSIVIAKNKVWQPGKKIIVTFHNKKERWVCTENFVAKEILKGKMCSIDPTKFNATHVVVIVVVVVSDRHLFFWSANVRPTDRPHMQLFDVIKNIFNFSDLKRPI